MRIALFSDIHGNSFALDAVLADIEAQGGVDAHWVLGDLVKLGPDPAGVLERLAALDNALFVCGNTDRYIVTGTMPYPGPEDVAADLSLLPRYEVIARQTGWTQGIVTAAGYLGWLEELPVEQRLTLPDGTRLLGVHASPGHHSGPGFHPELSRAQMEGLLRGCEADLVCVGHTHCPMDVRLGPARLVNLGSLSFHLPEHLYASYVLLEADAAGYGVRHRRVDYDRGAAIEMVRRVRFPNGQFLIDGLNGRHKPTWQFPPDGG